MKTTKFESPVTLEALANNNPLGVAMRFVFTDDQPNKNLQGIPQTAFAGLVNSGRLMPVKMEEGRIGGHFDSTPLGAIDVLEVAENKIVGNAILWANERPSDIALLRDRRDNIHVSFEVKYSEFEIDDNGVEWLLNPVVQAATIVSNPAYQGRTPILSIASEDDLNNLPDDSFVYIAPGGKCEDGFTSPRNCRMFPYKDADGKLDKILLDDSVAALSADAEFIYKDRVLDFLKLAESKLSKEKSKAMDKDIRIEELETSEASLKTQIDELTGQVTALTEERDGLVTYKTEREAADAKAELLTSRLALLKEAGLSFSAEEVTAKSSLWLSLDDDNFAAYVADIKGYKKNTSEDETPIPATTGTASVNTDTDLIKALLNERRKKEH